MELSLLKKSIFEYCNRVHGTWSDTDDFSAKIMQRRFMYAQSRGALHSSNAYWILRDHNQDSEAQIMLRNLLERLANSFFAKDSSANACQAMAKEMDVKITQLERWIEFSKDSSKVLKTKANILTQLVEVEGLLENRKYKDLTIAKRFFKSKLDFILKGAYAEYCGHTNPTIDSALGENQIGVLNDYFALLIPVECAFALHQVLCSDKKCDGSQKYSDVVGPIKNFLAEQGIVPNP